jgi:hypothetical protein
MAIKFLPQAVENGSFEAVLSVGNRSVDPVNPSGVVIRSVSRCLKLRYKICIVGCRICLVTCAPNLNMCATLSHGNACAVR